MEGEYRRAEENLLPVLAYLRTQQGRTVDPLLHIMATNDLAVALTYQYSPRSDIANLFREALESVERSGLNPAGAEVIRGSLGWRLLREGQLDEAEPVLRETITRMKALPERPLELSLSLQNLAWVQMQRGDYEEAESVYKEAVELGRQMVPLDHPYILPIYSEWGRALAMTGDTARGCEVTTEALAITRKIRPAGHYQLAQSLIGLGACVRLQGRPKESETFLQEAVGILRKTAVARDPRLADALGELGLTLRALQKPVEADAALKESYALYQSHYGDAHPATRRALDRLQTGPR